MEGEREGKADPIRFHARPTRPAGAGVVPDERGTGDEVGEGGGEEEGAEGHAEDVEEGEVCGPIFVGGGGGFGFQGGGRGGDGVVGLDCGHAGASAEAGSRHVLG